MSRKKLKKRLVKVVWILVAAMVTFTMVLWTLGASYF